MAKGDGQEAEPGRDAPTSAARYNGCMPLFEYACNLVQSIYRHRPPSRGGEGPEPACEITRVPKPRTVVVLTNEGSRECIASPDCIGHLDSVSGAVHGIRSIGEKGPPLTPGDADQ